MDLFQRAVKAVVWVAIRAVYRVKITGAKNIPVCGPCVLIPNHVSYLDAAMIAAHTKRPIKYAMYYKLYNGLKWIVEPLGAFPIAGRGENREIYDRAFVIIAETLDAGGVICIFPEGQITRDGKLGEFRPGITKILARNPVPVVPVGLCNLWGSYFSKKKPGLIKLPEHFMERVTMRIGHPMMPTVPREEMRERVGILTVD